MLAIAQLCKTNNWKFDYYCSNKAAPVGGNWEHALSLGMNAHSLESLCTSGTSDRLVIPQGGSVVEAELGIREVAEGILQWNRFENLNVIVPSGTGTTSFYLAKHLYPRGIQVYTVPCVGNENYLYEQIYNNLGESKENVDRVMRIVPSAHGHKFAHPYEAYYRFWKDIHKETNVELDLIYAPKTLLSVLPILKANEVWLYVHTGGTLGNQSQIERYKRKYKL
jgi:1-aminocyclopropane-1-carboxylate deaminase/D-cysteine desulfhydrase-like pyridoxal-dependent ACC family enzyme